MMHRLSMVKLDTLVVVLNMKLAEGAPHWGELNRISASLGIRKTNCKKVSNL
jgi:hypothetical protein